MDSNTDASGIDNTESGDDRKLAVTRALTILLADTGNDNGQLGNLKARLHQGYDPSSEHAERGILIGQNIYADDGRLEAVTLAGDVTGAAALAAAPDNIIDHDARTLPLIESADATSPLANLIDFLQARAGGMSFVLVRGLNGHGSPIGTPINANDWLLDVNQLQQLTLSPTAPLVLQFLPVDLVADTLAVGPVISVPLGPPPNPPVVNVTAASGSEDHSVPLAISVGLTDPNGNGTLVIVISGLPAGATLSAGVQNANGSWTLSPGDLAGLTLIPPPYWSGALNLTIAATSTQDGVTSTVNASLPLSVVGVANTPSLSALAATGLEDHTIPLSINAATPDPDGSETLSVVIAGLPTGSQLSAGTLQADGSWLVSGANLAGLTLTPPLHWSGSLTLTITATTSEDGSTASSTTTLPLSIGGVATSPNLSVTAASGSENTGIALGINAALADNDGSETLSIIIGGLPAGATLSAGTQNPDGTWTLSPGDLAGLTLNPPPYWSGTFNLTITAQSSENGSTATTQASLPVSISGSVGIPHLSVAAGSGNEDQPVPLTISASIDDNDGSETLVVIIGGLPPGGSLSAGTQNPDGTWTVLPGDLAGLTFNPPPHASGSFNLTVTAISTEGGQTATTQSVLPITVTGAATTPNLSLTAASGNEGTAIPIGINATLADTDGSETLSITVTGLPAGSTLSAGTQNPDGSWTLLPGDLPGLTFTPPPNWSGSVSLTITATSSENGSTASISGALPISVSGTATTPSLSASAASGSEDTAIPLAINAALVDTDGSETLSVTISGLPAGSQLSAGTQNADGSWTLNPADLAGLILTPPPHWSGSASIVVTATSSENGSTASTSTTLPLTISGSATSPNLAVSPATGAEGNAIPLAITASLADTDGSETLTIVIGNLPAGATLSAGTQNPDGTWSVNPADLPGLTLNPPLGWSGNTTLTVTAISSENGSTAAVSASLPLGISGVATTPNLSVLAASGNEDSVIPLPISASLADTDGSETLSINVSGVPFGATLSAGTQNPDGSWTLAPGDLTGLTLTPPPHFSGSLTLTIAATSSENGSTATITANLPITINGVASAPNLIIGSASGAEDTAIALPITASLNDNDGSETLGIVIGGVPAGATLSAGTLNADGTWSVDPADLASLTLTPPAHWSGTLNLTVTAVSSENGTSAQVSANLPVTIGGAATAPSLSVSAASGTEDSGIPLVINAALVDTDGSETLAIVISNVPSGATLSAGTLNANGTWSLTQADLAGLILTPPLHWSGSLALDVAAISNENGTTATTHATLGVTIAGTATAPNLITSPASGAEDSPIALPISASLADTDGSETLAIKITGVPAGATLSAGTLNADGSWSLVAADLAGLTLMPPAHWSGALNLTVTATSSENGSQVSVSSSLPVSVAGAATAPSLAVSAASGVEGQGIPLVINAALTDTDGSETLAITITGLPAGGTLSAGTQNPDGSWTLTPAQLAGLVFNPPADWSGNIQLGVTATSSENGSTASVSANLPLSVSGVATAPVISLNAGHGTEDQALPLTVSVTSSDADGSDTLSVVITGVPANASLSAGTRNADGSWSLAPGDLAGLTFLPPPHWSGSLSLTVTAQSSEGSTFATSQSTLPIVIDGDATPPSLSVGPATGPENQAVALAISAALVDTDGSETLGIVIGNLPVGATLSAGTQNPDGTWTLTPAQLAGLTLNPPAGWVGDTNLTVSAISTEGATTATTSANLHLSIGGIAETPLLSVAAANGSEDTAIPLTINAALTDTDGSETLAIVVAGLPAGATLSAGTQNPDGSWTLNPTQLAGLTLTPPLHWSGAFNLTVTATSSENSTTASVAQNLAVTVSGDATPPNLAVAPTTGTEDNPVALTIAASLNDTDGSETLSILIGNLPAGATLSAGTQNPDGTWSLTPAQLSGLTLIPPAHFAGAINLAVSAISHENGAQAVVTDTLAISIGGVATAPNLAVSGASGAEDTAIPLAISASPVDNDGSEVLSLVISGLPAGASLSAGTQNADGSWTLTPAQLSGLTLTPPAHWSGSATLVVNAITSENGTFATTSANLPLNVSGAATAPNLSVQPASGAEDNAIPLNITASLNDTDGSETLSLRVTGVPSGATLSAGTLNPDGSWTLTPAELAGLTLTPPAHWSGSFALGIAATSSENGTTSTVNASLPISITGSANSPTLNVAAASGNEDSVIPLNISSALVDTDGSETLSLNIAGLPAGSVLSAGTQNANGSWTLAPSDLAGLTLTPPTNWSGNVNLTISATSVEGASTATSTATLPLTIVPVADAPSLAVNPASGIEDQPVALNIAAALVDTDGSETLSINVSGLPAGASLSAGTLNADGSWTLAPADLTGLTFIPPAHASGSFTLNIAAAASEGGSTAISTATLGVTVGGVATNPTLNVAAANGTEDQPIALAIAAALVDTDGSETLSINIAGVPGGASLSAGTRNADGTWTLASSDLAGLTLTPPLHWAGALNLTVTATSAENGTTASVSQNLPVTVLGDATTPNLAVSAANGTEDIAIPLSITASLADTDGSETLSLIINGLPPGASLSAGTLYPDGSWNLTPADLVGLTLIPPAHWSGSFNLSVSAISIENGDIATVTTSLPVSISGAATTPSLSVGAASGTEDTAIPLGINAALVDTDGSETLSVTVAGVPSGASLSAGTLNPDGSWTLTPAELSGLTLTPPAHWSGTFNLTVTATSTENGTTANTQATLPVTISGDATAPALNVTAASGAEDSAIPLGITAALVDTDGSETLSVVIAGVPSGATLSAGTLNANGTWTLSPADLTGLTLTPPAHWSGGFNLTVSAISAENGTTATTQATLPVNVTGAATTPALSTGAASGNEDTPIALPISAALIDTDGSETLSVVISGLPAGATLSAGTPNADGSWTLTPAELAGLTLNPPSHWSGSANLSVTAIASENGTQATTSASLPLTVSGVATAPSLGVSAASGAEDNTIPLSINAALVDTDGSETLSLLITGLPAGASLSAGTQNADGSWSLTPADLSGLTLTPPLHWSGTATLGVTAISSENGTHAQTSANLPLTISGVATTPNLSANAASGTEDTAIALNINASLADTDGSETLSLNIAGVPAGASLSAGTQNPDGTWTLTPAQLTGLTVTPPLHWAGSFALTVTATSSENATTASTQASLPVTVAGTATPPALSVTGASGTEGQAVPLAINAALVDTDGSETLAINIAGLPSGASLSAGTQNADGSWSLTPAQLSGLNLIPPANFSGAFNLTVTATSSENGTTSSVQATLGASIAGVATTPLLAVSAASGSEDNPVALSIGSALVDTDGSETLSIHIDGVPAGASLSAGMQNPDGSWTLSPADLAGLTLSPPANWSGSFTLAVTATSSEGTTSATASANLGVTIGGVADAPLLNVASASGSEDSGIALSIASALVDTDGSETLGIRIDGVPAGASLSAGTQNPDGSWSLSPAQLTGLTLIPPANWSGSFNLTVSATSSENGTTATTQATLPVTIGGVADAPTLNVAAASGSEDNAITLSIAAALTDTDGSETLGIRIEGVPAGASLSAGTLNADGSWSLTPAQLAGLTLTPPANWSGSFNLTVSATSSENGTTATTQATLPVTIGGVADTPTLNVAAANGTEDNPVALSIASALNDTDGSESLAIVVTGVPTGASLSAGTHNTDGSWSLTPAQLAGLTLSPPANWSGSFNLTVTATSSENGTTATTQTTLPVTIGGVADAPTLNVAAASGSEDNPVALSIASALTDTDGSESLGIVITGVPASASLSAGTHNPDGSWSLTPAQLSGLTLTPPANWSGSFNLTVAATSSENGTTATTQATLPVTIGGVADTPTLNVAAASGSEDNAIALSIASALTDTDGSESLNIRIEGVPASATLSAGTHNADGSWSLTPAQLSGLTLTPPANWSGNFNLTVTATSSENGTSAATQATLPVTIGGVADAPALNVAAANGSEDNAVGLSIAAAFTDTDGSETLGITITGVPAGASLSAGTHNADDSWSLTPAQLTGLSLTPSANYSGSFNLTVVATSSENGTTATTQATLPVTIGGVADAPTLNVAAASGNEDDAIALSIAAALTDNDGSETLGIRIEGVPTGASLSAGTQNADGSWSLTPAQLTGLTLSPPANWSGNFNLTITATSSENNTTAATQATLPVTIAGVADQPNLTLTAATGSEDTPVALTIASSLVDTDGSETLGITIAGVPSGASLSTGTHNSDGSWSLTPAQLTGLTMTPPANYSGAFNLTVTATASENGTTATRQGTLPVSIGGVADAPTLNVAAATGTEDNPVALSIASALTDTDGSETLGITITGVPSGASLSVGTHNPDGSWSLTPAQLTGLTLSPPTNWSGSFNLTVTATSSENGTTATTQATLPVTIGGVADQPNLTLAAATGSEDSPVALTIASSLVDTDGSETLGITITGVPTGASLSAGTHNPDGSWSLTPAQLTGLALSPPTNFSGTFNLTVTATASENGTTATRQGTLAVSIGGVADTPTLNVTAATGTEDTPVALSIAGALTDTDGSETLGFTITGVPAGASLSAGTHNPNGSWSLTPAQLTGLTLSPPANWSGNFNLTVTATSSENGTTATTQATLPVSIGGVADQPNLTLTSAAGNEDNSVSLVIASSLVDTDGSETLGITITGVPTGAFLSAGTHNPDGSWSLTPSDLPGLTLTPAANYSGNFNLTVTATASENGTTATRQGTLGVSIFGIADAPTLNVVAATGAEDSPVALSIGGALVDTDGSETLGFTITGLPAGAALSAGTLNANGSWSLTPAQLSGLTLIPAANYSGVFSLTVTATSSENGTTATTQTSLPVTIGGVADTPTLTVAAASGNEDNAIALSIAAALTDTDGSESLGIRIEGVPAGASLSAGTHNADGSWSLTSAQLAGLTLSPPTNWSGSFNLTVTATASENGTTAAKQATLPVTIAGVADQPNLTLTPANGSEDTAVALTIASSLVDTDGSETLGITITGVPTGASLSAGTHNPDGSWSLTPAQLAGLTLSPPANWSGSFNLTVTATASENGTTATRQGTLAVSIGGVADTPTLSVAAATGTEDNPVALSIASALTDTDGSETLSVIITGMPSGATLSAGTHNANGSWTLTPAQLTGLTLTPPANYSGSFNLTVTATSSENGTTATTQATLPVTVTGIADQPNLTLTPAAGNEDNSVSLVIASSLVDTDGSETLGITITGVPTGAFLSAGTHNPDGSWSLTPSDLPGLTLTPVANYSGTFNLTVTATASENGTTATRQGTLGVSIFGIADAPTLNVVAATGVEDTPVALSIGGALVDTDGSESLSFTITGLPTGASLSAGTHNANGSWTLTPAQLTGLTLTTAANYSGVFSLTVTATSSENGTTATTQASLPVTIGGVADTPTVSASAASGLEDTAIALTIGGALTDTDGSETLTFTITGMPAGASLSAGTHNANGSWTLTPAQLTGLTLTPPTNFSGSFSLTVTATASENGTTATQQTTLGVTVAGVADAPSLGVVAASGSEDTAVALSVTAALTDTDGSEALSIRITGVPGTATLSAGIKNADGSWSLTPAQLTGLTLTPPANYSGTFNLTVAATSTENATTATTQATLPVTIGGVADTPTLSVSAASGNEDTAIPLTITSALTDTDGSETLSIRITGMPSTGTLSAGTKNADGSWTLTPAQLTGLTFTPPTNWAGSVSLTVTATSSENGTTATQSTTLPISVAGVADTPNLSVSAATGNEDTAISLSITTSLADTDGSETLSLRVTGMPAGATLSAGTLNGDGSWTLTPAQLSGLKLTPPTNFNGSIALTVTATASENGTTATKTATLNVGVTAVADAPNLTVAAASGLEDTAIPLSITPALTDTDGSEVLSVRISGVPAGAVLSAGLYAGGGVWAIAPSALAGLTITPPKDFAGTVNLTVRATSTESSDGSTAYTEKPLVVTVTPVADAPKTTLGPSAIVTAAIGNEDTAIPLNIGIAAADGDGSETLTVKITGVPTGGVLSAGTNAGGGVWNLTAAQVTGLTFTPPVNKGDDYTFTVTVTSTDTGGVTASTSTSLSVVVNAIADAAINVTAANAVGTAGSQIPLTIAGALSDTDGSETLSFVLHGMPDGFALNAGVNNGDNSWTLTPAQLSGLKLVPPPQFNGQLNLHLQAITRESEGSTRVTGPVDFNVRIGNYASGYLVDLGIDLHVGGIGVGVHVGVLPDIDLFPVTGGIVGTPALYVKEDTPITLTAQDLLSVPILQPLLTALNYITFENIPTGTTFSSGSNLGGGVWRFNSGQLSNLVMTPAPGSDVDFTLVAKANLLFGLLPVTLTSTPVYVQGIADMPTLAVSVGTATEDTNIALNITGALTDIDTPGPNSETLSYMVSGLPTGFALNQGTANGNGTWSLTAAQAAGLAIVPAANFSGAVSITVSAIATERDGDQTVKQQTVGFTVTAVADAPIVATSGASGTEDQPISLNLAVALTDTDGSESISSVVISGLPSGASLTGATNNGNGTWSVVPAQIGNVQFVPPSHWSGDTSITITATSREGASGPTASTIKSIPIHVEAAATTPLSSATDSSGDVDTPISLHLTAALADTDGSERLSIVVGGMPSGSALSAGLNNGDGSWTLTAAQLSGLSITPPSGFSGDMHLTMSSYSIEQSNGSTATSQNSFTVSVNAPAMMMMSMMSFMAFGADSGLGGGWTEMVDGDSSLGGALDDGSSSQNVSASDGFSEGGSGDSHHNDYQHAFDTNQAA